MTEKNRQTEGFDFSNKCALLDTNILKELLTAEKQSSRFSEVFEFLRATNSFPYIIRRITDFEFVGYSTNKKAYDLASSFGLVNLMDCHRCRKILKLPHCSLQCINVRIQA
jgi:hypothetical protein